jgi:hypothetical protein
MYRSILFIFVFLSMIVHINSYGCSCSCCAGLGCSLVYLGSVSVRTCASTACSDACKAAYTPCAIGLSNVVCEATNIFNLYSSLILISFTFIFIVFAEN